VSVCSSLLVYDIPGRKYARCQPLEDNITIGAEKLVVSVPQFIHDRGWDWGCRCTCRSL
jgi:hypothetical protein